MYNCVCCPTPLAGDWGYAGRKIRFGQMMDFWKLGDLLTPPAPEAPVMWRTQNNGIEI